MKKSKVMPKSLQIQKLKQFLKRKGIDEDLVDLEALVDSTLSYKENKKIVLETLKIAKNEVKSLLQSRIVEIQDLITQAKHYHEQRSERARRIDESKKAKVPKNLEVWFRKPQKYDLPEVDSPIYFDVLEYLKGGKNAKKKKKR